MIEFKEELVYKRKTLLGLDRKRKDLEDKISLIYSGNIDMDYLDELARRYFCLIRRDEICILLCKA